MKKHPGEPDLKDFSRQQVKSWLHTCCDFAGVTNAKVKEMLTSGSLDCDGSRFVCYGRKSIRKWIEMEDSQAADELAVTLYEEFQHSKYCPYCHSCLIDSNRIC